MQSFTGSGNRILVLLMMNAILAGIFLVLMPTMPIMAPLSLPLMMNRSAWLGAVFEVPRNKDCRWREVESEQLVHERDDAAVQEMS